MPIQEEFKAYLSQIGYSESTIRSHLRILHRFLAYVRSTIPHISTVDIVHFYAHLKQLNCSKNPTEMLSESYVYAHMSALKVFFNWLEINEQISCNPISPLKFKKPNYFVRIPLTEEEIEEMFNATITLKEVAVLHLCYSCGLRRAEVVNLQLKDLHFNSNMLYVREGKGKKRRAIPMTAKVSTALENYWKCERAVLTGNTINEPFMLGRFGLKQSHSYVNRTLKRILIRTTITREVSPHYLRHSIATHLLSSGVSLENVRQFLGHKYLETTQIYTKVNLKSYKL